MDEIVMIIKNASFKNLHGHLDMVLSFREGVNILIGSNGSGKTSILNAMAWILSPASVQDGISAAYLLSGLKFDQIDIEFTGTDQGEVKHVTASRSEGSVSINITDVDDDLSIPILQEPDPRRFSSVRAVEEPNELIARWLEDRRDNPVLRYLNQLPGPLYLPLSRRWTEDSDTRHRRLHRRSTTAGHLPISEVLSLADRVFRQEQSDTIARNENLRNDIVTSLFQAEGLNLSRPVWTMSELRQRRQRIVTALRSLGLEDALKIGENYFAEMEDVIKKLGGQRFRPINRNDDDQEVWLKWWTEGSPIATRIEGLIPLIEQYESDMANITRRSTGFLSSVNSFIGESGKELKFSRGLDLSVALKDGQLISSHLLSSGELQLLVLFTFLYFQFDPDQEFSVFVDEPELSLHIAWQNRYVNSITEANPNAQFIIATHSPEIAGPAEDAIIDISPEVRDDVRV